MGAAAPTCATSEAGRGWSSPACASAGTDVQLHVGVQAQQLHAAYGGRRAGAAVACGADGVGLAACGVGRAGAVDGDAGQARAS